MAPSTDRLKFGFVVPWADAREVGDLAAAAEDSGWDGLFVWEPVWGVDALLAIQRYTVWWVLLFLHHQEEDFEH